MGVFAKPVLSDLPATRIQYKAGDRILVRVSCALTLDQYGKVERAVKKYTQSDVRVIIFDCSYMTVLWQQQGLSVTKLVCREDIELKGIDAGVANLNCSAVELLPGDRLLVYVPRLLSELHRHRIADWVRQWTGKDVDVVVMEGNPPA